MKPSDRISEALRAELTKLTASGYRNVASSELTGAQFAEIGRILDEITEPMPHDTMSRVHRVVELLDDASPKERLTLLSLLSYRYGKNGERT